MAGVRGRKARRNRRVNTTNIGKKRKKKMAKNKPKITNPVLKKHWDLSKTLKQNLKNLGIAADPNVGVTSGMSINSTKDQDVEMSGQEIKPKTEVIQEFEKEAQYGKKTERLISEGEAKFLLGLMNDYGDNYKAMARDKRNYYQHTPKQLKRKCEKFLVSPYYQKFAGGDQTMETE